MHWKSRHKKLCGTRASGGGAVATIPQQAYECFEKIKAACCSGQYIKVRECRCANICVYVQPFMYMRACVSVRVCECMCVVKETSLFCIIGSMGILTSQNDIDLESLILQNCVIATNARAL